MPNIQVASGHSNGVSQPTKAVATNGASANGIAANGISANGISKKYPT